MRPHGTTMSASSQSSAGAMSKLERARSDSADLMDACDAGPAPIPSPPDGMPPVGVSHGRRFASDYCAALISLTVRE